MERLKAKWWVPAIAMAAFAVAISLLAPRYTDLQVAGTAAAFRDAAADVSDGRNVAAGVADMFFVVAYLALALTLSRPNLTSRVGLAVMALAALADVTENSMVIRAIAMGDDVTDATVDAIRMFGVMKWTGAAAGGVLILVGLFLNRRNAV